MYRIYLAAADMLPAMLILLPVFLLLDRVYFRNIRNSIFYFIFSCYLCTVYVLVGLPTVTYFRPEVTLNLIPLAGMTDDLKNSFLNILLFVPLGIMIPLLWSEFETPKKAVLLGLSVSFVIELLQMLTFRTTDINDLITNTLGTCLGFLCAKPLLGRYRFSAENKKGAPVAVFAVVLILMFFVYPFASRAFWDLLLA